MGQKQFKEYAPVLPEQYDVKCFKTDSEEIMKVINIKNVQQEYLDSFISILKVMPLLYTENITQYSLLQKKDEYLVYTMEVYESSIFSLQNKLNGLSFSGSHILYEIINGISIFHDNNIIHGNIKPTNILLSVNHHYYLSDYCLNLLKRVNDENNGCNKGLNIYNLNYTSPELLSGKEYSFSTDIWSFGCVLIFLLTGKDPFGNDSYENVKNRIMKNDWILPNQPINELYSTLLMSTMCLKSSNSNNRSNIEELRSIMRFKDDMKKRLDKSSLTVNPNEISIHSTFSSSSSSSSSLLLLSNQLSSTKNTNTNSTPKSITNKQHLSLSQSSTPLSFNSNEEYKSINTPVYVNNLINKYLKNKQSVIKLKWRNDIYVNEANMKKLVDELKKNIQLKELYFKNCKFHIDDSNNSSKIFFNSFLYFTSLTKLDLSNNGINDEDIIILSSQFKHLSQLLSLKLDHNNMFSSNGFLHLCHKFIDISQLQELGLSNMNMDEHSFKFLCYNFSSIPNLEYLDISNNKLIGNDIKCLVKYLSNISKLKSLNIGNNLLTHLGITYLCNSLHLISDLRELNIENIELYSDGIKTLCKYFTLISNLTSLNISRNHIQNDGMNFLSSHIKYIRKLKNINISKIDISSNGLSILVKHLSSSLIKNLEEIDVSNNSNSKNINVKDFIHNISYFSQLKSLNIAGMNIGDDNMILLSEKFIYLPCLQELDISKNNISDNSLEISSISFNNCKHLKNLNVSRNFIKLISTIVKLIKNVNRNLDELNLSNNQLENSNLESLITNLTVISDLKKLNLCNTNISNLTVNILSKFLSSLSKLEELDISNNHFYETTEIKDFIHQNFSNTILVIRI